MQRIIFICPYFGKLPHNNMQLWLQSCSYNKNINWLIITDDRTKYDYPDNVKIKYSSFSEIKQHIQKKFNFTIGLESPYKLCDFKPAYGYIFSEYIQEYDFWGHCDLSDCIFGDLRKFINDNILVENDKVGFLGHMTLYRNTREVNERFMLKTRAGLKLEQILGVRENKAFDELTEYGINQIYKEYQFSHIRMDDIYVDISPIRFAFQATAYDENYQHYYKRKVPMVFEWNEGHLFECSLRNKEIVKREIAYVHFQKRKMNKDFEGIIKSYFIIPNFFTNAFNLDNIKNIKKCSRDKIYSVYFIQKWKALKYRFNHLKA